MLSRRVRSDIWGLYIKYININQCVYALEMGLKMGCEYKRLFIFFFIFLFIVRMPIEWMYMYEIPFI